MLKPVGLFLIFLTIAPAFGQSTSKYQVGTITEVKGSPDCRKWRL